MASVPVAPGKVWRAWALMKETKLPRHKGFFLVFTARPHMSFTVWLIFSRDPWEKLLALLAIIIVWPLVLGGHASTNAEMNGRFVLASRVSPPQGRTVMVRSGGLVFSTALRRSGWALISGSGQTFDPKSAGGMVAGRRFGEGNGVGH